MRPRLATGYQLSSRGLSAVADREVVQAGAGAVYSTTHDMARYTAALLGGANAHGRVLRPETLASMFQPHYQPDLRIPGMGLGFFRSYAGEHQTAGHDGIWAASIPPAACPWPGHRCRRVRQHRAVQPAGRAGPGAHAVLRSLLDLPDDAVRTGVPDPVTSPRRRQVQLPINQGTRPVARRIGQEHTHLRVLHPSRRPGLLPGPPPTSRPS